MWGRIQEYGRGEEGNRSKVDGREEKGRKKEGMNRRSGKKKNKRLNLKETSSNIKHL